MKKKKDEIPLEQQYTPYKSPWKQLPSPNNNNQQLTVADQEKDEPLAATVEAVFKKHFKENGEKIIDTLSKVDPSSYLKHLAAIMPKKVAIRGNVSYTKEEVSNKVSRQMKDIIDSFTGRIYEYEPDLEDAVIIPNPYDDEDMLG